MKRSPSRGLPGAIAALGLLTASAVGAQTPTPAPAATAPAAEAVKDKPLDRSKASLTQTPSKEDLKPSGPVTISAKSAELVQGDSAVYTGDVVLTSNTLKLDGDRVELKQYPGGQYEAKITGAPAHVNHAGEGPDNPPLVARARTLNYDSRSGVLDMVGDAFAMRGGDQVSGNTIRYIVKEHRIQAAGGDGRVTVVIQPHDDSTAPAANPASNPGPKPPPSAPAPEPKP